MKKVILFMFVVCMVLAGSVTAFAEEPEVLRLEGADRYQTAVAISREGWVRSDSVVLARGDGYADALAGVPLAYAYDAPILLTQTNRLNTHTLAEIKRLGARKVIILGGTGAVSAEVEQLLKEEGLGIERISGKNRYDTAAKVAYKLQEVLEVEDFDSAVMVYGQNFPDALSVASHAARLGRPIFLTNGRDVDENVKKALQDLSVKNMDVIGGEAVISKDVVAALGANRISGPDRYETALAVTKHYKASGNQVYLATGGNFADAVTGGVLAAKNESGLLLVNTQSMTKTVKNYIDTNGLQMTILGGEKALSDEVWQGKRENVKSYIEVSSPINPIYWVNDRNTGNEHWFYAVEFRETNGVGLEIEEIRETYYSEFASGHYFKYDQYQIKEWWGDNYIEPNEVKVLTGGGNRCDTESMVWSIKGTDDNGNKVAYQYTMDMSQESVQENKDQVFKLVEEGRRSENADHKKAYLEITKDHDIVPITGGSWFYKLILEEKNDIGVTITEVVSYPFTYHGIANYKVYGVEKINEWWGDNYISAGEQRILTGGNRYERDLDNFVWIFKGIDDHGNAVEYIHTVDLSHEEEEVEENEENITEYPNFDTANLRYDADFEVKVSDGVHWVPAGSLGRSRYTNRDIEDILEYAPGDKQAKIDTLYEALQLYQVGNFKNLDGTNERKFEGDINWEYHIPGYESVRINGGNCSTSSSWLRYILDKNYDDVGFIAYSQEDGSGHVWNYIKEDGYYYFIDLTHYRMDFIDASAIETGKLKDYYDSDIVAGNIHRAESVEDYVNYYRNKANDPPEMFFIYTADYVSDIGSSRDGDNTIMYYPDIHDIEVVYDDPEDNISVEFVDPPNYQPDWSTFPGGEFESVLPF